MNNNAILLTAGLLDTPDAKTAHGLIRESGRYIITGVVDPRHAGKDAGEVLDGKHRGIPIFAGIEEALVSKPSFCIIGVATTGGIFPPAMLEDVRTAITNRLSIVNGLHDALSERPDIAALAEQHGVRLLDIRKPKARADLHFWTGGILQLDIPIVAILGTDCSLGKRTTSRLLLHACNQAGVKAQMIYTGQTGWLQGGQYGFIFDSTLNDFVAGELEHAILTCAAETRPDLILIEGQSALRNPSGPCGSELLISGNARRVIVVHAPKREYFDHYVSWGRIPSLESEIELIGMYGATVLAVALNTEGCTKEEAHGFQRAYSSTLNLPVILPLEEGCDRLVGLITSKSAVK